MVGAERTGWVDWSAKLGLYLQLMIPAACKLSMACASLQCCFGSRGGRGFMPIEAGARKAQEELGQPVMVQVLSPALQRRALLQRRDGTHGMLALLTTLGSSLLSAAGAQRDNFCLKQKGRRRSNERRKYRRRRGLDAPVE